MYQANIVIAAVKRQLAVRPTMSLAAIAVELKIDRHTVARDLQMIEGLTFNQLRAQFVFQAIDRLLSGPRPLALKELGTELGCSSRALSRWVKCHERWVTLGRPVPRPAPK